MSNNNNTSGGLGCGGVLTIVFVVLKLCGVISWSWLWVLSPVWITAIIVGVMLLVFFLVKIRK